MSQERRTGLNHSKNLFWSKNLLWSKSLPWLCVGLKASSHYLSLVFLHLKQYSYTSNKQYCQLSWRGFPYEK